jgi:hypothetical protein
VNTFTTRSPRTRLWHLTIFFIGDTGAVDMMAWLHEPTVSWEEHFIREAYRAKEADRQLSEYLRGQDEKWADGTLPSPLLAFGWSPEEIVEFERGEIEYALWAGEGLAGSRALCLGISNTGEHPLVDNGPFELGERAHLWRSNLDIGLLAPVLMPCVIAINRIPAESKSMM